MRHDAQRSVELQDMLPADEALYGFRLNNCGTSMLNALRAWEKRRGIQPAFTPQNRQQKPAKPARVKKTREELLARKRDVARARWANMPADKKRAQMERIWAWARCKKQNEH